MKRYRYIFYSLVVVAIAVFLMFNKLVIYGVLLIAAYMCVSIFWKSFMRQKDSQIANLENDKKKIENQLAQKDQMIRELEGRKINILQISDICEIGLFEVNSSFTRVANRELKEGKARFFGALRIDICAKYGVDMNELKFNCDAVNNIVTIYNLKPRFLSFAKRHCEWQIAETLELVERNDLIKLFGAKNYWTVKDRNDKATMEICEEIRQNTEKELENGPEEFHWIIEPLKKQIIDMLRVLFFNSQTEIIVSDSQPEIGAKSIMQLNEKIENTN